MMRASRLRSHNDERRLRIRVDPEHRKNQLRKAHKWIEKRTGEYHLFPVVENRRGYAEFIAYVYKAKIGDRHVWYCMEVLPNWGGIKNIRRICV
jgi:hypothetical protein